MRIVWERVLHAALCLLAVSLLTFGMVRLTGDPALVLLPVTGTQADYVRLRAELGLDRPLPEQYIGYLGQVVTGNFGTVAGTKIPVAGIIEERLPPTLQLGAVALLVVFLVGVPVGLYSAYWHGGWLDRIGRFIAIVGQSAPQFWVGLLLIFAVAVRFRLFPAGGYGGLESFVLPALTISGAATAGIIRLMRSCALEVLNTDYVRFCRMKGLSEHVILWKHVLRNALLPVLTLGGVLTGAIMTGSIVTESVFDWPGLGQLTIQAIQARDFPVIQATVLIFAVMYIGVNLAVDIMYIVLSPRLRAV